MDTGIHFRHRNSGKGGKGKNMCIYLKGSNNEFCMGKVGGGERLFK